MNIWVTILIIAIPVALSMIYWFAKTKAHENKLSKIRDSRPTLSKTVYVDHFQRLGYQKERVELIHQELHKFIKVPGFSIYPEDNLFSMYMLDGLDDVALIDTLCEKLSIPKPEQKDFDYLADNFVFNTEFILNFLDDLENK